MKAILIDAIKKQVTEIEISNSIEQMQKLIKCDFFGSVPLRNMHGDMLYVDDEGLYNPNKGWFLFHNYPQPLSGNGLLMGVDKEGESVDVNHTVDSVKVRVRFIDL